MKKVTIVFPENEDAGVELEIASFRQISETRIVIDLIAAHRLIALLGQGYGDRFFILVDGQITFVGCRIVKMGADCTIDFMVSKLT